MIPLPLYGDLDLDEMPPPRTPIALRKPAAKEPFLPLDALTSPITPTGEPIRKKPLPPLESLPPLKKPTPVKRAMVIDVPVEKEITAPQKKPKKKAAPKENAVPKEKSTPKDKAPPKEKAPPKSKATPKSRAVPKKVKEAVSGDAVSEISVPGPGNGTTTTQPVLETVSTAESVSPTTSKNSASESGPSVAGKRSRDELEETLEEKKARYDKRIERMVLEALDDPEFTELCEAVGSVWQRMGLGKELE